MNETRLLIQLMNRSDMLRFVEVQSSFYQNTISYLNWKAASNNRRTLGAIKARSQQYTLLFSPLLSSPLTSQFLFPPVCLSSLPFLSKLHLAHITRHATLPPPLLHPQALIQSYPEHWFSKELSKLSRPGRSALARHKLWTLLRRCFWKEGAKNKTDDTVYANKHYTYVCVCFFFL